MTELKKALKAKGYQLEGGEVTDTKELGYSTERNVALIKVTAKGFLVNPYRGYWYKPAEFISASSVDEVVELIEGRFDMRGSQ